MSKIFAIAGRELRSYFASPVAYILAACFMLLSGFLFGVILFHMKQATLQPLFQNMAVMLLLLIPAFTMRLIAEERKNGTIELLMTSPIHDRDLVIGKYLSALAFLVFLLALTLVYPVLLSFVAKPDWATIWTGYLGIFLLGAAFMAVGTLISSLTSNVVVAAVGTFVISLILWLLPSAGQIFGGTVSDVVTYLSVMNHQENLGRGVIDTIDLLYYASFIIGTLFLTIRSVETYHWR